MEGAIIGAVVAVLLAIFGSSWRLSSQIRGIEQKVSGLAERIDRADLEGLRDRVVRIEARCPLCDRRAPK